MTKPNPINHNNEFDQEQKETMNSIKPSRVVIPVVIGVIVVAYLLWKQFDPEEFKKIQWTQHTLFWILASVFFLVIRHISYMTRLYILTEKEFSWKKCFELIFIWEFSTAVSPTSVGGSAVALFVLSQEKLSTAKTATIVVYTVILDALIFILGLPVFYLIYGQKMIAPPSFELGSMGGGAILVITYFTMMAYSAVFAWGIFINPKSIKRLLLLLCRLPFLKRFRRQAYSLGTDIVLTAREMRGKSWKYHFGAFIATASAWVCRFLLILCLIIAFATDINFDAFTQGLIFARLESMFVILLLFPTPGGAGFAEFAFGRFLSDYIPATLALTIAITWRLLAYYTYLFAGAIVIPNWIRNLLNQRREQRLKLEDASNNS